MENKKLLQLLVSATGTSITIVFLNTILEFTSYIISNGYNHFEFQGGTFTVDDTISFSLLSRKSLIIFIIAYNIVLFYMLKKKLNLYTQVQ